MHRWCRRGVLTVGMHAAAERHGQLLERDKSEQTFLLTAGNDVVPVRTAMIGDHHIYNCLVAAAVGLAEGIDLADDRARAGDRCGRVPRPAGTHRVRPAVRRVRRLCPHARRLGAALDDAARGDGGPVDLRVRRRRQSRSKPSGR